MDKICPTCGAGNPVLSGVCGRCNNPFPPIQQPQFSNQILQSAYGQSAMKICPKCKVQIDVHAPVCLSCGHQFSTNFLNQTQMMPVQHLDPSRNLLNSMWMIGLFTTAGLATYFGQFFISGLLGHLTEKYENLFATFGVTAAMVVLGVLSAGSAMAFLYCYSILLRRLNDHRPGISIAVISAFVVFTFPLWGGALHKDQPPARAQAGSTNEKILSIRRGMDVEDVLSLLGQPPDWEKYGDNSVTYFYNEGEVSFSPDGMVIRVEPRL